MNDLTFDWIWSQISDDIAPRKRSTYCVILEGAWEGKTYANIAGDMQYSEVYWRQDLAPEVWTFLSKKFGIRISKKTLKTNLTDCYNALEETQAAAGVATSPETEMVLSDILPTLTASCTVRASSVTLGYCPDIS